MTAPLYDTRPAGPRTATTGWTCGASGAGPTWPTHRILFLLAGTFTLTGTALAVGVSRWFAVLPALVGVNQLLLVATGWCPASAVLDRVRPPERG